MSAQPVARGVIVVDVQEGFLTADTRPVLPAILGHLDLARGRHEVVIATRFLNRPRSLYETERDWCEMTEGPETELAPGVADRVDLVIPKHGLAPVPGDLLPELRRRGVQRVALCGFDTDQCVLATALLLWDAGIAPQVIAPLCASAGGPDMHESGLAVTRRAIGDRNVTDENGRPV